MTKKHIEICEGLGWRAKKLDDGDVELESYSPAGEDLVIYVSQKNFVNDIEEYAENFDIDEHIEMWIEAKRNGVRGVPSARELVEDAYAIQKMLNELAEALTRKDRKTIREQIRELDTKEE